MLTFSTTETHQMIKGPQGQLECLSLQPKSGKKAVVIVCHPHPLYQGTMKNKVVFTIAKAFHDLGLASLRFNYRGVGQSAGSYGQAIGESEDLLAVVHSVQKSLPDYDLYLAGFSFGTYVATRVCNQLPQTKALLTVAPSVEHFDFTPFKGIRCPWVVVQGEADEVVSPEAVYAFAKERDLPLIRLPECSHFFHGRLTDLRNIIHEQFEPIIES